MDDISLESRLSAAVDELQPSADFDERIAVRIAQRQQQQRVARAGVSVIAGLVVVAMVGTVIAVNQSRGKKVVADRPGVAYRWSTLPAPPLPGRENAASVWTGTEVIFWGGMTPAVGGSTSRPVRGDGAAYDPATGTWRLLPAAPIGPRSNAASVWTGTEMIVWGGWRPESPNSWADGG